MVRSMEKRSLGVSKFRRSGWLRAVQMVWLLGAMVSCEVIHEDERYIPIDMAETNRTTLLVEFSALKCVNCPEAAEEAHNMLALHGQRLVVVEMHPASNSLTAAKPAWDYTCEESDIYYKHFGGLNTTPLPTGVINMTATNDGYFLSHTAWGAAYQASAGKISHIDIWQEVAYDAQTRTIALDAYITNLSTLGMDVQYIVWLTEDSIIGPQMMPDGSLNQTYSHNHVLRDALTDVWGMPLQIAAGETQEVAINYALPEKVQAENCNIVGVVMKDDEVVQVKEYKLKETI